MELVLLGTAGGPVWWPDTDRAGISSAVRVGSDVYLVDFGDGSGRRFKQAALVPAHQQTSGGLWGMEAVRGMFITHLHSDHVVDYANFLLMGWTNGLRTREKSLPIRVYGPGPRVDAQGAVMMEPVFEPSGATPEVHVESPANPVPGTTEMTEALYRAFALDINDRLRDNRYQSLRDFFETHDIDIPVGAGYHPNENPSPDMEPFEIYRDEKVAVRATLVNHSPLAPAFGFRFDSETGSVVFSGDTGGPNDNLIALARGADVLVHEVISAEWIDRASAAKGPDDEALRNHLRSAHTLPEDAARVAAAAGVHSLVFSHVVPGNAADHSFAVASQHFSGKVVVGRDLMRITVGQAT